MTFFLLSGGLLIAREAIREEMTIPLSKPGQAGKLECRLVNGSITVTGYSGNEVQVIASHAMKKISVETETGDPDKEGMKKITSRSFNITAEGRNMFSRPSRGIFISERSKKSRAGSSSARHRCRSHSMPVSLPLCSYQSYVRTAGSFSGAGCFFSGSC